LSTRPAPDVDTALVLGMASTALPFAASREEQAERWLRILRMYGDSGAILQRLGVSEAPLEGGEVHAQAASEDAGSEEEMLASVGEAATSAAESRGAVAVSPGDVLVAVIDIYGEDFDRVLRVHGTDRAEVLERLHSARAV
jgi:hypothetical protein